MLLGIQLGGFYFRLQDFHLLWCIFQMLCLISALPYRCPTTPSALANGLGCFLFARRYWGNRFCFLFLQLLRCFSSLGWLVPTYEFSRSYWGFSHSEIFGSLLVSSSPKRFVGNYVLLRLCVPRYPPLALSSLTCYFLDYFFDVSLHLHLVLVFVNLFDFSLFLCSFQGSDWSLISSILTS